MDKKLRIIVRELSEEELENYCVFAKENPVLFDLTVS